MIWHPDALIVILDWLERVSKIEVELSSPSILIAVQSCRLQASPSQAIKAHSLPTTFRPGQLRTDAQ